MITPAITGTGVFTPRETITNDELVEAFNAYAEKFNIENAEAIEAGELEAKSPSSTEFILSASGIEQRYVMDKSGVLDPEVMHPVLRPRADEEPGLMAEMALSAARDALAQAVTLGGLVEFVDVTTYEYGLIESLSSQEDLLFGVLFVVNVRVKDALTVSA